MGLTQKFQADYESLDQVREFVGQVAEQCGFSDRAVYQVQLATDEAFTNIIEHAYAGEKGKYIECACQINKQALVIILHDCGKAFDPIAIPEPDLSAPLEEREVGGLEVFLMRRLMDEIYFEPAHISKDGCNTLTMVKRKEKPA